jgi:uncharacterized protein YjeT (DUF2065 family)
MEINLKVDDVRDLFREREFDPFTDDVEAIGSIAELARLPHLASRLKDVRVRVLLPTAKVTPRTERDVQRAFQRYCAHAIADVRRRLSAMRWVGLRTFLIGLLFFGISLAASTAVQRLLEIPEQLRTLASESLIVAGWVILWQPLDTLVAGWWPHWEEERTLRAISTVPLRVIGFVDS